MITKELLSPESIVVVGASNDISKPGGKVLNNIIRNGFKGKVYAVNPNESEVQGVPGFSSCSDLPEVDLAIIAVAAKYVEEVIRTLAYKKNCKGYIVFSAGFGETGDEGKLLEQRCVDMVNETGGTLIGPNCIGVITESYKGVFAGPIPEYDPKGCDFVSASGATMVFIVETAIRTGLKFSSLFSVGNCAQIGVEDILEYWDNTFDPEQSSRIKLLYLEQVQHPDKFLKHARSLVRKGCRIAAIKAGSTEAGSRAVSSHTGSMSGSNTAVSALFRKAGIVRCYSRLELVYVAAVFSHKALQGDRIAVITHAGGPGVMLTDTLIQGGMKVPNLVGEKADGLLAQLFPGSSVSNPIDFLATGTAEQLGIILDAVDNDFDQIDGSVVVFGTTGMWSVDRVYDVLNEKLNTCKKPIFPILPSVIQAADELKRFHAKGQVTFTDEVSFGYVLSRVFKTLPPPPDPVLPEVDRERIRSIIDQTPEGYLNPDIVYELFTAANIPMAKQVTKNNLSELAAQTKRMPFPWVMKVVGPLHKSEVGGVMLNVSDLKEAEQHFTALMSIPEAKAVLIQEQVRGTELFLGASRETEFGHVIITGLGGIMVEVFRDISSVLSPVAKEEAEAMIQRLQSYPIVKGVRGKEGVNEALWVEQILRLSALLEVAPEIKELDLNPLMGTASDIIAVDGRVLISK